MAFELIALLSTTMFAAICLYVAIVEHPARLASGTAVALAQWRPSYRGAAALQILLAIVGVLSAIAAYLVGRGIAMLIGGIMLATVTPFTLIIIMPTNKRLLDESPRTRRRERSNFSSTGVGCTGAERPSACSRWRC